MLSVQDNELLTQVGPGTPMGDLFRRFWIPALLSREVPDADGPPKRLKVLGEDLLAFRDSNGRAGVVEPRCAHRGADLYYGRVEDCGIRCVFHGWLFGIDGTCKEAPTVPEGDINDRFRKSASIRAYPVREAGDLIWIYMGPAEKEPPFPHMEFTQVTAAARHVDKKLQDCNWAQLCEGGLDTAHFSFLHMPVTVQEANIPTGAGGAGPDHVRWMKNDPQPRYHVKEHAAGLVMGGCRQADGNDAYWRIAQFLMPSHGFAPSTLKGMTYTGQTWIPIDDVSTWVICYSWNPERDLADTERGYVHGVPSVYSEVDEDFVPIRNRHNDYLIDRAAQKSHSFSGIEGISEQDSAIQESQGLIADRTRERLGPTDIGIVRFRRLMLESARALAEGVEPSQASAPEAYRVRSGSIVIDSELSFDEVLQARFGSANGESLV